MSLAAAFGFRLIGIPPLATSVPRISVLNCKHLMRHLFLVLSMNCYRITWCRKLPLEECRTLNLCPDYSDIRDRAFGSALLAIPVNESPRLFAAHLEAHLAGTIQLGHLVEILYWDARVECLNCWLKAFRRGRSTHATWNQTRRAMHLAPKRSGA